MSDLEDSEDCNCEQVKELTDENRALKESAKNSWNEYCEVDSERQELRQQIIKLKRSNDSLGRCYVKMKSQLEVKETIIANFEESVKLLTAENESVITASHMLIDTQDRLQREIGGLELEIGKLEAENEQLMGEMKAANRRNKLLNKL